MLLKMAPPRRVPPLPFRWQDFVYGAPGKCFAACVIMCCKYWIHYEPNLDIPLNLIDLEEKLGYSFYSRTGLYLSKLRRYLKKTQIREMDGERFDVGLTIEMRCPLNLEDLYPFFLEDPPIPIILVYDKSYTERNIRGDSHAVIVHSLDYEKEKIYVIDPIKRDLRDRYPYDFLRFKLGWEQIENLALIVAPLNTLNIITGRKVSILKQTKLTSMGVE